MPEGGTLAVLGLGPIGDMACRIALHRGHRQVIGVDLVPERLRSRRGHRASRSSTCTSTTTTSATRCASCTDGRGPDSVIDAVGWRRTARRSAKLAQQLAGLLPDAVAANR